MKKYVVPLLAGLLSLGVQAQNTPPDSTARITTELSIAELEQNQTKEKTKGIYIPGWKIVTPKQVDNWITFAQEEGINTIVVDTKNVNGDLFFNATTPLADSLDAQVKTADGDYRAIPITYLREQTKKAGIKLYARHVMFRDKIYYNADSTKQLLHRERWINPRDSAVLNYNFSLLEEQAHMGFDQIILDYIRFPDVYDFGEQEEKYAFIDSVAQEAKQLLEPYNVELGLFVYGCVLWRADCSPIGQRVESLDDIADNVYPMIYPSHFRSGAFGLDKPGDNPYIVIDKASERINKALNKKTIIPMLQAFSYTPQQASEQIAAVQDNNMNGFIFWNAAGKYDRIKGTIGEDL